MEKILRKKTDKEDVGLFCICLQGATIRRDDATGAVTVARVMRGGAADRSGKCSSLTSMFNNRLSSKVLLLLKGIEFDMGYFKILIYATVDVGEKIEV